MKLLLDTNVILDYLGVNDGFGNIAEDIINLAITGEAIELVSASAITDIYYVAEESGIPVLTPEQFWESLD